MNRRNAVVLQPQFAPRRTAPQNDESADRRRRLVCGPLEKLDLDLGHRSELSRISIERVETGGQVRLPQVRRVDEPHFIGSDLDRLIGFDPACPRRSVTSRWFCVLAQVDAINPAQDRLQVSVATVDRGMIQSQPAATRASDQHERIVNNVDRGLPVAGPRHREAKAAAQHGPVLFGRGDSFRRR